MLKLLGLAWELVAETGSKWLVGGIIGIILSGAFASGFWAATKVVERNMQLVVVKYKVNGKIVKMNAIKHDREIYYPSKGINSLLSEKYNINTPHLKGA